MDDARWATDKDIPLSLTIVGMTGVGASGQSPEISIQRYRDASGVALDGHYWDGSGFTATETWLPMNELGAPAGVYDYLFQQTLVGLEQTYLVSFRNTAGVIGFVSELHIVTSDLVKADDTHTRVQALQTAVAAVDTDVAAVAAAVSNVDTDVAAVSAAVANVDTDVAAVASAVAGVSTAVAAVDTAVAGVAADVATVDGKVDQILAEQSTDDGKIDEILEKTGDIHKIQGLDSSNPMSVNQTSRTAGDVSLTIQTVGGTVTVTRQ